MRERAVSNVRNIGPATRRALRYLADLRALIEASKGRSWRRGLSRRPVTDWRRPRVP